MFVQRGRSTTNQYIYIVFHIGVDTKGRYKCFYVVLVLYLRNLPPLVSVVLGAALINLVFGDDDYHP